MADTHKTEAKKAELKKKVDSARSGLRSVIANLKTELKTDQQDHRREERGGSFLKKKWCRGGASLSKSRASWHSC